MIRSVPATLASRFLLTLLLTAITPRDRMLEAHLLLIEHGRKTCKAINPKCEVCMLKRICPYGKSRLRSRRASHVS